MTVPMKALKAFPYAGRRLVRDQEFEARGRTDARVLAAIGHAVVRVPLASPPPPAAGTYNTRVMTAAAPAAAPAATPVAVIKVDGADVALDGMERGDLHALADRLGVKVHPLTGPAKLRQALLDAQSAE